jgi:hypothetical protein
LHSECLGDIRMSGSIAALILRLVLHEGEWPASRSGRLISTERAALPIEYKSVRTSESSVTLWRKERFQKKKSPLSGVETRLLGCPATSYKWDDPIPGRCVAQSFRNCDLIASSIKKFWWGCSLNWASAGQTIGFVTMAINLSLLYKVQVCLNNDHLSKTIYASCASIIASYRSTVIHLEGHHKGTRTVCTGETECEQNWATPAVRVKLETKKHTDCEVRTQQIYRTWSDIFLEEQEISTVWMSIQT